ncbi:chorismate mutase [Neobacillus sp. LXY-1]|uniref:chorismate mutase n=1 Tax=Neobacillus sp. LXY-1 TaxID=3379133 RepID=UPI003EE07ECE
MIRGVRGATTVHMDDLDIIISATEELVAALIKVNDIQAEAVASVFISTTNDLTAAFPARALRKFEGWTYVPVMCMQEISVPNALKMCVRIMIHLNTELPQSEIKHVYLNGAKVLRPDLPNSLAL